MFAEMLSKRINFFRDKENTQNNEQYPCDYIIETLFHDKRHFLALIDLSHGLPRNFFNNLFRCLSRIQNNLNHNFLHWYLSADVVMDSFSNEKRATIDYSRNSFYAYVQKFIMETKSYFFLLRNEDNKQYKSEIESLLYKEIVHRIKGSAIPLKISNRYKAFYVDLGYYFFTLHSDPIGSYKSIKTAFKIDIPFDIQEDEKKYLIKLDGIDIEYTDCPNCYKRIGKSHPVYKDAKMCRYCGIKL